MNPRTRVVIVTHAGPSVGGGHASRCFALARGLAGQGADVRWLVNDFAKGMLLDRGVLEEAVTVVESPFDGSGRLASEAARSGATLFVVDGYDASPALLGAHRRLAPVVFVDDCRVRPVERECDVLLNYNLGAESLGYEAGCAELLLGPRYALLRPEFGVSAPSDGDTLLIVPGASDTLRTGERFVEWWREEWPEAELVLGPLAAPVTAPRPPNLSVVRNPEDLPMRMACSRAVLCTSSVTAYEAMALRKPLIVFQTAENQTRIGEEIGRRGLGRNLGAWRTWGAEELEGALRTLPQAPAESAVNANGSAEAAKGVLRHSRRRDTASEAGNLDPPDTRT